MRSEEETEKDIVFTYVMTKALWDEMENYLW
jgi:hypothetical protein